MLLPFLMPAVLMQASEGDVEFLSGWTLPEVEIPTGGVRHYSLDEIPKFLEKKWNDEFKVSDGKKTFALKNFKGYLEIKGQKGIEFQETNNDRIAGIRTCQECDVLEYLLSAKKAKS